MLSLCLKEDHGSSSLFCHNLGHFGASLLFHLGYFTYSGKDCIYYRLSEKKKKKEYMVTIFVLETTSKRRYHFNIVFLM